jgi:glycosyltransferase involved in cell wall biosynthesis
MLRIGIDYRPALILRSGIARYVSNLVRHLPEVDPEIQLALFSVFWEQHEQRIAAARLPESDRVKLASMRFPGRVLDFLGKFTPLSVETWASDLELFHFTDYVHPPVKTKTCVCTIFDTSYLRAEPFHTPKNQKQLAAVAASLIERAKIVLTISETSKRDIMEHYELPPERIIVTPLGVDEIFLGDHERCAQSIPYVLMVGTIEPRKNVERTLRAFERVLEKGVEARFVLAGRKGWMCDEVFELLERPRLKDAVHYLGEISDEVLVALLYSSTVLAYPSLWEGFGLPVLEGMATGLPVLTSKRGALEEVAGDGAHLVDPESEDEIALGLEKMLTDSAYRAEIAGRGRARAQTFSWEECARKTVDGYRRALAME